MGTRLAPAGGYPLSPNTPASQSSPNASAQQQPQSHPVILSPGVYAGDAEGQSKVLHPGSHTIFDQAQQHGYRQGLPMQPFPPSPPPPYVPPPAAASMASPMAFGYSEHTNPLYGANQSPGQPANGAEASRPHRGQASRNHFDLENRGSMANFRPSDPFSSKHDGLGVESSFKSDHISQHAMSLEHGTQQHSYTGLVPAPPQRMQSWPPPGQSSNTLQPPVRSASSATEEMVAAGSGVADQLAFNVPSNRYGGPSLIGDTGVQSPSQVLSPKPHASFQATHPAPYTPPGSLHRRGSGASSVGTPGHAAGTALTDAWHPTAPTLYEQAEHAQHQGQQAHALTEGGWQGGVVEWAGQEGPAGYEGWEAQHLEGGLVEQSYGGEAQGEGWGLQPEGGSWGGDGSAGALEGWGQEPTAGQQPPHWAAPADHPQQDQHAQQAWGQQGEAVQEGCGGEELGALMGGGQGHEWSAGGEGGETGAPGHGHAAALPGYGGDGQQEEGAQQLVATNTGIPALGVADSDDGPPASWMATPGMDLKSAAGMVDQSMVLPPPPGAAESPLIAVYAKTSPHQAAALPTPPAKLPPNLPSRKPQQRYPASKIPRPSFPPASAAELPPPHSQTAAAEGAEVGTEAPTRIPRPPFGGGVPGAHSINPKPSFIPSAPGANSVTAPTVQDTADAPGQPPPSQPQAPPVHSDPPSRAAGTAEEAVASAPPGPPLMPPPSAAPTASAAGPPLMGPPPQGFKLAPAFGAPPTGAGFMLGTGRQPATGVGGTQAPGMFQPPTTAQQEAASQPSLMVQPPPSSLPPIATQPVREDGTGVDTVGSSKSTAPQGRPSRPRKRRSVASRMLLAATLTCLVAAFVQPDLLVCGTTAAASTLYRSSACVLAMVKGTQWRQLPTQLAHSARSMSWQRAWPAPLMPGLALGGAGCSGGVCLAPATQAFYMPMHAGAAGSGAPLRGLLAGWNPLWHWGRAQYQALAMHMRQLSSQEWDRTLDSLDCDSMEPGCNLKRGALHQARLGAALAGSTWHAAVQAALRGGRQAPHALHALGSALKAELPQGREWMRAQAMAYKQLTMDGKGWVVCVWKAAVRQGSGVAAHGRVVEAVQGCWQYHMQRYLAPLEHPTQPSPGAAGGDFAAQEAAGKLVLEGRDASDPGVPPPVQGTAEDWAQGAEEEALYLDEDHLEEAGEEEKLYRDEAHEQVVRAADPSATAEFGDTAGHTVFQPEQQEQGMPGAPLGQGSTDAGVSAGGHPGGVPAEQKHAEGAKEGGELYEDVYEEGYEQYHDAVPDVPAAFVDEAGQHQWDGGQGIPAPMEIQQAEGTPHPSQQGEPAADVAGMPGVTVPEKREAPDATAEGSSGGKLGLTAHATGEEGVETSPSYEAQREAAAAPPAAFLEEAEEQQGGEPRTQDAWQQQQRQQGEGEPGAEADVAAHQFREQEHGVQEGAQGVGPPLPPAPQEGQAAAQEEAAAYERYETLQHPPAAQELEVVHLEEGGEEGGTPRAPPLQPAAPEPQATASQPVPPEAQSPRAADVASSPGSHGDSARDGGWVPSAAQPVVASLKQALEGREAAVVVAMASVLSTAAVFMAVHAAQRRQHESRAAGKHEKGVGEGEDRGASREAAARAEAAAAGPPRGRRRSSRAAQSALEEVRDEVHRTPAAAKASGARRGRGAVVAEEGQEAVGGSEDDADTPTHSMVTRSRTRSVLGSLLGGRKREEGGEEVDQTPAGARSTRRRGTRKSAAPATLAPVDELAAEHDAAATTGRRRRPARMASSSDEQEEEEDRRSLRSRLSDRFTRSRRDGEEGEEVSGGTDPRSRRSRGTAGTAPASSRRARSRLRPE